MATFRLMSQAGEQRKRKSSLLRTSLLGIAPKIIDESRYPLKDCVNSRSLCGQASFSAHRVHYAEAKKKNKWQKFSLRMLGADPLVTAQALGGR